MVQADFRALYALALKELKQNLPEGNWEPYPAGPVSTVDFDQQEGDVRQLIDHTALKPETTGAVIEQLCREAIEHNFHSVCVPPCRVELAARCLRGRGIKVCTVIGFPHGSASKLVKVTEAVEAAARGAAEVDMVLNLGALKERNLRAVGEEIQAVKEGIGQERILKVILETALLDDVEKILAALIAVKYGADFVKTSTGFAGGGATANDVRLLRRTVGKDVGVKASGGIRDLETALAMVRAGANRIGTSSGIRIAGELAARRGEGMGASGFGPAD
ncbi:Deoxyribose-phosphate aldolase [Neomoorella glycerini]|uniref:Deoxyribose-phosphate aldolase n=1 Tax=Neomoorella glycerini TaxID=55779 RepID=A0A6I5ZUM5_9FIRM|nr:deoxyribose-phosphate aldolase [Moorella glycerini]QGP93634.1 Deoxyribose-phosphate aldolase [Moorella glycerini]